MKVRPLLLAALGLGALAFAADAATLYVRAKNTKLLASPSPTANAVATLQPGDPVTWIAPDAKDPRWHRVQSGKKSGYVFQTNLTSKKPTAEVHATTRTGVKALAGGEASKGAAVKALGDGALSYAEEQPELKTVVDQLQKVDEIANKVTAKQLAQHTKTSGLPVAVGGDR